jgi:hypothetical protein
VPRAVGVGAQRPRPKVRIPVDIDRVQTVLIGRFQSLPELLILVGQSAKPLPGSVRKSALDLTGGDSTCPAGLDRIEGR